MTTIGQLHYVTATIANAGTTSGAIETKAGNDMALVGIVTPAALTGTTLTFTACNVSAAGTFVSIVDSGGSALTFTMAASKFIRVDPVTFAGVSFLKLVSGSSEGADRVFTLVFRRVH